MSLSSLIVCRAVIAWGSKKLSRKFAEMDKNILIVVVGLILINSCSFALIVVLILLWNRAVWSRYREISSRSSCERAKRRDYSLTKTLHTPLKFKLLEKLVIGEHIKRRWIAVMSTTIGEETFSSASFTMPANLVKRMSSRSTGNGPSSKSSWGGFGFFYEHHWINQELGEYFIVKNNSQEFSLYYGVEQSSFCWL